MLSIINNILDLSKIESGKMEMNYADYEISSVINDVISMTEKRAEEKGLKYSMNISPYIPSVLKGDEMRVRQIMLNLINNAIKYTHKGSVTTDVMYDFKSNRLKITVEDTGVGIRKEDIGKLFEAFQRLDENKNKTIEGTGLGLRITQQLVEMMGGNISVESEYGVGSKFSVEIDQEIIDHTSIGDVKIDKKPKTEKKEESQPMLEAPNAKVLAVDDNKMNLKVLRALLKKTKMQVTLVESGRQCIDSLIADSFDVVLLDIMMPEMTGVEALHIIRDNHIADDTPIIALTADAVDNAKENYLKEGFSDYLSKPIIYKDLEEVLKKHLKASLIAQ